MVETLAGYYGILTKRDRRLLLAALNFADSIDRGLDDGRRKYELATLMFASVDEALHSLVFHVGWVDIRRDAFRALHKKLKRAVVDDKESSFIIYLNDKKVAKRIGAHPERGFALKGITKRVTVGVKWSLPKRDHIPDDNVLVNPVVTLNPLGRGKWRVTVEAAYRQAAERYLLDNLI